MWSVYYDTPALRFYWEKIEGLRSAASCGSGTTATGSRSPTRPRSTWRSSSGSTGSPRSAGSLLPYGQARQLCDEPPDDRARRRRRAAFLEEVLGLVVGLDLRPVAMTGYQREAFVGRDADVGPAGDARPPDPRPGPGLPPRRPDAENRLHRPAAPGGDGDQGQRARAVLAHRPGRPAATCRSCGSPSTARASRRSAGPRAPSSTSPRPTPSPTLCRTARRALSAMDFDVQDLSGTFSVGDIAIALALSFVLSADDRLGLPVHPPQRLLQPVLRADAGHPRHAHRADHAGRRLQHRPRLRAGRRAVGGPVPERDQGDPGRRLHLPGDGRRDGLRHPVLHPRGRRRRGDLPGHRGDVPVQLVPLNVQRQVVKVQVPPDARLHRPASRTC